MRTIFQNAVTLLARMEYKMQMINFMKNSGLLGGILMVLGFGPGGFSVDALLMKRQVQVRG